MSPKKPEQYKEIREQKKELIMQTALELFANKGIHSTSISNIASKAGISKGLMYNYFDSKDELIKAVVKAGFDDIFKLFDPNKDGYLTDKEFVYFIDETFKMVSGNIEFWKLYFAVLVQPCISKLLHDEFEQMMPELMKVMVGYFERKGSNNPVIDSLIFHASLDGILMNYVNSPDMFPLEDIKKRIIERNI